MVLEVLLGGGEEDLYAVQAVKEIIGEKASMDNGMIP